MQIGEIRFSNRSMTLTFPDGRIQSVSTAQGALLMALISERGRVVSRSSLREAMEHVGVKDPRLDTEMRALGKLVGKDWAQFFESVDDQGFLLHSKAKSKRSMFDKPSGAIPVPLYLGMAALVAIVVGVIMLAMPEDVEMPFTKIETVTLASGNQIEFRRFGRHEPQLRQLKSVLAKCNQERWQTITTSVSGLSFLHVVIEGGELVVPKNYKFLGADEMPIVVTLAHLQEAGICDN